MGPRRPKAWKRRSCYLPPPPAHTARCSHGVCWLHRCARAALRAARLQFVRRLVAADVLAALALADVWPLDADVVVTDAILFFYAQARDADAAALLPRVHTLGPLGLWTGVAGGDHAHTSHRGTLPQANGKAHCQGAP